MSVKCRWMFHPLGLMFKKMSEDDLSVARGQRGNGGQEGGRSSDEHSPSLRKSRRGTDSLGTRCSASL